MGWQDRRAIWQHTQRVIEVGGHGQGGQEGKLRKLRRKEE